MINFSSKTVRLSADTLSMIEDYRGLLKGQTKNDNIRKYIEDYSIDKILRSALYDAMLSCTKS